jgi:hypothetical protein
MPSGGHEYQAEGHQEGSPSTSQEVSDSVVRRDIRQIRGVAGSVRLGKSGPTPDPAQASDSSKMPSPARPSSNASNQSVAGTEVGGSVEQVDQVGGDLDIDK